MTMPEASINKDCNTLFWKNKIWVTLNFIIAPPSYNVLLFKRLNQLQFRRLILLGFDSAHDIRSLFFAKNIGHSYYLASNSMRRLGSLSFSMTIWL